MSASGRPIVSIVAPTYDEAANIIPFLESAHRALGSLAHEIIVVDDNSPDLTWQVAENFAKGHPWVTVYRRLEDRGLSSAVLTGFEVARGSIFGVMDADLSHDEKILPDLIQKIIEGGDLAVGSRRLPGGGATHWPFSRRIMSHVATALAKWVLKVSLSDPMSGYFVLKRSLYESCRARLSPMGYKILLEIYCKGKPENVREIPFVFKDRTQGYSKLSRTVIRQYLQMLTLLWKNG